MQLECRRCRHALEYQGVAPRFCSQCGAALGATVPDGPPTAGSAADEVPETVGGYRLLQLLGEGGMGRVFEAEQPETGRRVALKLINPDCVGSPEAVERFRQEGRLASTISHPRCVFVYAADEEAGRPYLVMELMPGGTLEHVVAREGPLPPERAVGCILDVLDGLAEAHRAGVVHRDVKPSNCFLEADGRIKVGDFGLARPLLADARITRSGTFLGTLLYAAPEQVRGERIDARVDVYAAAATLYYLLAGRSPFEGGDAAATLARVVSEPAPSLRSVRARIPAGLDEAVRRGLERDRSRRWRDVDEFRTALLPFVPGRLISGTLRLRFLAFLLDFFLFLPWSLAIVSVGVLAQLQAAPAPWAETLLFRGEELAWVVYFTLTEGLLGCSLGKWALGLRVCAADGGRPPGLLRVLVRSVVWITLLRLMRSLRALPLNGALDALPAAGLWHLGVAVAGPLLLFGPMRRSTGYRGLHEWVSGTCVIRLPERPPTQAPAPHRLAVREVGSPGVPRRVGGFEVRGVLNRSPRGIVLLGEDAALGRSVVLWLRATGEPLSPERRLLARPGRLRWLTEGGEAGLRWDAFLAPDGCPLPEFAAVRRGVPWSEARPLLEQLTEELTAARQDGTLPETLSAAQLWVRPDGRLLLLDLPLSGEAVLSTAFTPAGLLREAAFWLLEGRAPPAGMPPRPIRARVPLYAARLLQPLSGDAERPETTEAFRAGLEATQQEPPGTSCSHRVAQLAVAIIPQLAGLGLLLAVCGFASLLPLGLSRVELRWLERGEEAFAEGAALELAACSVSPDVSVRLAGAACWLRNQERLEVYGSRLALLRQKEEDRRLTLSWPAALLWGVIAEGAGTNAADPEPWVGTERKWSEMEVRLRVVTAEVESHDLFEVAVVIWGVLLVWTSAQVGWSFLTRGSVSFWVAGLALVRADGRQASRLRCCWRALLLYLPLVGSVALGTWLDFAYWSAWNGTDAWGWVPWLSLACWWAWLGLLPLYAILALWRPDRAPHDVLAGTYLVPR